MRSGPIAPTHYFISLLGRPEVEGDFVLPGGCEDGVRGLQGNLVDRDPGDPKMIGEPKGHRDRRAEHYREADGNPFGPGPDVHVDQGPVDSKATNHQRAPAFREPGLQFEAPANPVIPGTEQSAHHPLEQIGGIDHGVRSDSAPKPGVVEQSGIFSFVPLRDSASRRVDP